MLFQIRRPFWDTIFIVLLMFQLLYYFCSRCRQMFSLPRIKYLVPVPCIPLKVDPPFTFRFEKFSSRKHSTLLYTLLTLAQVPTAPSTLIICRSSYTYTTKSLTSRQTSTGSIFSHIRYCPDTVSDATAKLNLNVR